MCIMELTFLQGGRKIVGRVQKIFCAFWVPQSPIGLISAEIGARCRIPGHAIVADYTLRKVHVSK